MSEKLKTKFSNLDNLLILFFGISLVVPTIVQSYGFDTRLIWMPTLCYVFWNIIVGYIRPNFLAADSREQSIVERIRGWSYLVALTVTLPLNFILLEFFPKTVFFLFAGFMFVGAVTIILKIAFRSFPKIFFKQEVAEMNNVQNQLLRKMLMETGSASIWISFALLFIDNEIVNPIFFPYSSIAEIVVASVFLYWAYRDNVRSLKIADNFAESLAKTNWHRKYITRKRRK